MNLVSTFFKKFWFLVLVVVIVVLLTALYLLGFRVGPGLHLSRDGVLTLEHLPAGATIYADETAIGTATATSTMSFDMVPGQHSIIVSVTNDYPWDDLISITSGQTNSIQPILIPEHPNVTTLSGSAKTTAVARIVSSSLPTAAAPLRLANGCADVYVSDNQVLALATSSPGCTPPPYLCANGTCAPTIIFSPKPTLQAVFVYPGRQDALVVAFNDVLYAIALDPRSPQYFAPILGATNPQFGTLSDGTIVIDNSGIVYKVNL